MLIVSYDISDDKLRTRFSKFLEKFGFRLQYSVFQVTNSKRVLDNIVSEVEGKFGKRFAQSDSVIIFKMTENCQKLTYGYAANDDKTLIVID